MGVVAAPSPGPGLNNTLDEKTLKQIEMVHTTLKDILESIRQEELVQSQQYRCLMQWYESAISRTQQEMNETEIQLNFTRVSLAEQWSTIANLKGEMEDEEAQRVEARDILQKAKTVREEEKAKFDEEIGLNTQSLKQINEAIEVLGKVHQQGGFLQAGGAVKRVQANEPGESSYALGVMEGLLRRLEADKEKIEGAEAKRVSSYGQLTQLKDQQLKLLDQSINSKRYPLSETQVAAANLEHQLKELQEDMAQLKADLEKLSSDKEEATKNWMKMTHDQEEEKHALDEALKVLWDYMQGYPLEPGMSFMQTEAEVSRVHSAGADATAAAESELLAASSGLGGGAVGAAAAAIANGRSQGTFDNLKKVVDDLIDTAQRQQDSETEKRAYCEKEKAAKEDEHAEVSEKIELLEAEISKKSARVQVLTNEVDALKEAQGQAKTAYEEATKERKSEKAQYEVEMKDLRIAVKVMHQTMKILADFYKKSADKLQAQAAGYPDGYVPEGGYDMPGSKAALVQIGERRQPKGDPKPDDKFLGGHDKKTVQGYGVATMLEKIVVEMQEQQKDITVEENEQVAAFEVYTKEYEAARDRRWGETTERVKERAELNVRVNSLDEELTEKEDELRAVEDQQLALGRECDELLLNFDDRKKDRSFEVAQLRDVIDILSGSDIAARTG